MDAIDLRSVTIHSSPQDIADWPVTVQIVGLTDDPAHGLALRFDHEPPVSWKWFPNPTSTDNYQFTVWAIVNVPSFGRQAAGLVQFWQGRPFDGSLPPLQSGYRFWWGVEHGGVDLGVMVNYVPQVDDWIGFFVSAGNARGEGNVTSVRERSNVVQIKVPLGDTCSYVFGPQPEPDPIPVPQPVPDPGTNVPDVGTQLAPLIAQVAALQKAVEALSARPAPSYQGETQMPWFGKVNVVLHPVA